MKTIEKIRQKIEHLKAELEKGNYYLDNHEQAVGYESAVLDMECFLDTLEEPVCEELKEAAEKYAYNGTSDEWRSRLKPIADEIIKNFIAGANWQKAHDAELIEIAYNDGITIGKTKQKEQMLKEAVKWLVDDDYAPRTDKGKFILGSVGIGYNGYYIPYSDLLKLPKEGEQ